MNSVSYVFSINCRRKALSSSSIHMQITNCLLCCIFSSIPCLRGDNALFFDIKESWKGKTNPSPELYLLNHLTFLEAPIRPMGRFVVKLSIKMFCEEINLIDVNKQQLSLFLDSRKRKRKLTINLLAHVNDLSLLMLSRRYTRSAMNG